MYCYEDVLTKAYSVQYRVGHVLTKAYSVQYRVGHVLTKAYSVQYRVGHVLTKAYSVQYRVNHKKAYTFVDNEQEKLLIYIKCIFLIIFIPNRLIILYSIIFSAVN